MAPLVTVVLKKTLESPLDCKEIQQVHPKGNQSWIYIGRTDAEAETPILWPPDAKNCLIGKDPDAGKDWRQEGERDDRGWDCWMASWTQWTWVWVNSSSWWWTGRPGVPQSMRSQRVWHDWVTELNWQLVKNPSAMREALVQSLGWEDPLEEGLATYSSILAWRILWTQDPGRLQSMGLQRVGQDWGTKAQHIYVCILSKERE